MGHLVVPLTFFAIALTNRRYGAGYALAQTVLAWLIGAPPSLVRGPAICRLLAGRAAAAGERDRRLRRRLFVAQMFSVLVFDRTRGPRWWTAPFHALLWGGLLFCLIAFPPTYLGTPSTGSGGLSSMPGSWPRRRCCCWCRIGCCGAMVPPQSGFGGY